MKKKLGFGQGIVFTFVTMFVAFVIMGQGRDDWRYGGRVNGKMSVRDSVTVEKTLLVRGAITADGGITGTGTLTKITTTGGLLAVRDSFSTTDLTKVVALTGAGVTDILIVSQRTYTYSAAPDTSCVYGARVDSANYVTVWREKLFLSPAVKSGAHFDLLAINK